ncbi:MAG: FAD-dependent oxidoreductase, partial [Sphingomonas bacterium]
AERIAALIASGQLSIHAGKMRDAAERADGIAVTWRARGADAPSHLVAQRVVNCTGPQGDLTRTGEPLLARLVERGAIRPDAEHLGIDVDARCRTIAADGQANGDLYAIGPMTRGAFWESVAVPDIRRQAWDLARSLSNAQWVEGEGL